MKKPRHLHNATSVEVDAIETGLALTFRTDGEIDLTVTLPREAAYQLRDHISHLSDASTSPDQQD